MSTFTSRDVEAADKLALARLDDDGAPSAVTWPQNSDSHGHHAIRLGHTFIHRGHIAKVASDLAEEGSDVKGHAPTSACGPAGATRTRPCPGQ